MVTRNNIKNKYDIFRSISKILVVLLILGFSQTVTAQQWERVYGDDSPGIRIPGEHPSCWFSPSHYSIESPSEITLYDIQYNSLGQVIEYYVEGTANEYPIETHIYDGTYNSFGQVSGFEEDRYYPASGKTYNIIVSDVQYDGFGNVKDGYPAIVNQDSLPIPINYIDFIEIYIAQIWDYGDPADDSDLTFEFRLGIATAGNPTNVTSVEFLTPNGNKFHIPKQPEQWSNGIWTSYKYEGGMPIWEYRARFTDLTDLQAYGDGEYTIVVNYTDSSKNQTTAWFGIPDTQEPIPQPTQEPVLSFPLHRQTVESPVTFTWENCTDPNAEYINIDVDELGMSSLRYRNPEGDFDKTETSLDSVYMPDGFWEAELDFKQSALTFNTNPMFLFVEKYSKNRYRFKVEVSPWTMYEVWGGNTLIGSEGSYDNIADLETNGYVKLGKSDGQTETFQGQYDYYLIATVGKFLLDSIQGSDGSYYSSFEFNDEIVYAYNEDNLLGPPDGRSAVIGIRSLWDDYSGYFVFNNPGNWEGLTVFTSDLNLNLRKNIVGTVDEIENIAPNETITYRIRFDSNDFNQNVTNITVVDILPDEVSFVPSDSNEVSGTYDPDKHTYTWSYPSLAPESAIELQLTVQVNPDIAPGTTITNFVTINSNETPPSTTSVDIKVNEPVIEITPPKKVNLSIIPNVLRRDGTSPYITAVIRFPEGIQQSDIDQNNIP